MAQSASEELILDGWSRLHSTGHRQNLLLSRRAASLQLVRAAESCGRTPGRSQGRGLRPGGALARPDLVDDSDLSCSMHRITQSPMQLQLQPLPATVTT